MSFSKAINTAINKLAFFYHEIQVHSLSRRPTEFSSGQPLIVGFLSSPTGLGEGARLLTQTFQKLNYRPSQFDLSPHIQPNSCGVEIQNSETDDGLGPIILHVNPPEIPKALALLGKKRLQGRKIIGVWAWELEKLPASWIKAQKWVDEIWATSHFLEKVFSAHLAKPVFYTGYPCALMHTNDAIISREAKLGKFNIKAKNSHLFTVFISFDPDSGVFRKNTQGAVDAFQSAFKDIDDVRLIIKLTDSHYIEHIPNEWLNDPRIHIIDTTLSPKDMMALILSCDCVLSLHRSEGYGFLITKALANGVPAIATAYSATQDFMACPLAYGVGYKTIPAYDPTSVYIPKYGYWADPDINDAVKHLRHVRSMPSSILQSKAQLAREWWKNHYNEKVFFAQIPQIHFQNTPKNKSTKA